MKLNERQAKVLKLVAKGRTNEQIAADLHLSKDMVKDALREIFHQLKVKSRLQAALKATKNGWVRW